MGLFKVVSRSSGEVRSSALIEQASAILLAERWEREGLNVHLEDAAGRAFSLDGMKLHDRRQRSLAKGS